jgi:predicted ATPase
MNAMHNLDPKVLEGCLLELKKTSDIPLSEMAEQNMRLGELAFEIAAFDAAAIYFKAGRGLFGPTAWEENPNAMLQLCSEGASACFITGDIEMTNALVDDVLSRDVPVREKFRAYEVKILSLQASQKFDESITTALDVRRQLGLSSPANKATSTATTLKEYIKTRRVLKNRTSNEIVALPDLEDERIIMGQRLLELLIPSTYQAQPTLFPLVVFLLVRTSIKHGINASSCDAFACYGLLLW